MRTYTYEEVRNASLEYFKGDELAADVFASKYALQDLDGKIYELTPADMHRRLAREFARVEAKYPNPMQEDEIFDLLADWRVVPQGGPMAAIGNPFQVQSLSNCFVVESPYDSYGGILKSDQEQVQIMKRRGGVGLDISNIRPRGLSAANAARTTDGIGVFMERYSNSCREVAQGGRRGALMLTISVHHPDVLTFANIKRDRKKVTGANVSIRMTDEFMEAVKAGTTYQQRFPVDPRGPHSIVREVDAREVWQNIIAAMRDCSEPGMLFWDTIKERSPADAYAQFGYGTVSTNPCVVGSTLIAVADGRNAVSIKQLASEGRDVLVYAYHNDTGKIVVRKMRNPRLTGNNVPVFKVTLEGGHSFKATANHKMIMRDGSRKRVDELKNGDQLWIAHKVAGRFHEALPGCRATQSQDYWWIKDCNSRSWRAEHREIWEHVHGICVPDEHVIHHVDFNALNNEISNLKLMTKDEHDAYHASLIRGENNPIFKIKADPPDPQKFAEYSTKMSKSVCGMNNPRAYDNVSNDDIREHVLSLTKMLGRRVSIREWYRYAKALGLPMSFTGAQRRELGNFYDLSSWAAKQLGFKFIGLDTRTQRTMVEAAEQGYDVDIIDGEVHVNRVCEWCGELFTNLWTRREIAFCSHSCSSFYVNQKTGRNEDRKASLQAMHASKADESRKAILDCYTELRFKLGRDPLQDEVRQLCKERNLSYRTGTKSGFKNWADVKEHAALYNHRVVSVEACGNEDVYNGTVDEEHTFCMALGFETLEQFRNQAMLITASEQCGEITLSPYDSCRLLLINLCKFVKNPFTPEAHFDYAHFGSVVQKAQRMMDDLIDLELEAIDRIIAKVKADPEPDDVKRVELELWLKIRNVAVNGRRTGLGITALGDTFAYLNMAYGSDESIALTESVYKALALNSYRASIIMAQERGPFPIFSHDVERDHPFINQVLDADPELRQLYEKHGRRNIANTTTAPAGTTSIETQTTSGCEPVLFLKARRKRKITTSDKLARVDEVDKLGDKWQYYDVYHHGVVKWMEVTGETDVTKSPYHGSTVEEIDWLKKIDIQAAAQRWICHSISNTTNLPRDVTVETVEKLCWHGWETGCKGVTIYRIGSRDAVIVKESDAHGQPLEIVETHAPKRPKELPCDIHRTSVQGENYLVLVGLLNGRPYEIFAGLQEHVEVPKKVKRGVLIKNGKNKDGIATYNLRIPIGNDDEMVFKDIVNLFNNPNHGALTRTLSLAMRHGAPIQYLVEQLRKDKHSDFFSFSNVIARVFAKNYIPDGTKATIEKTCPSCGGRNLQYQQGCVTCFDCGNSKCG